MTYTHMRVDRPVAGGIDGDLWVRTLGGTVGKIAHLVEGQATFNKVGKPSLLFVRHHLDGASGAPAGTWTVVEAAQGEYPISRAKRGSPQRSRRRTISGVLVPPAGPPREGARFAREVLEGWPLDEAVKAITAA